MSVEFSSAVFSSSAFSSVAFSSFAFSSFAFSSGTFRLPLGGVYHRRNSLLLLFVGIGFCFLGDLAANYFASFAESVTGSIISSLAFCIPTARGSSQLPPQSEISPTEENACVNFAFSAARMKSQASARLSPRPRPRR